LFVAKKERKGGMQCTTKTEGARSHNPLIGMGDSPGSNLDINFELGPNNQIHDYFNNCPKITEHFEILKIIELDHYIS
jgi:hypothetical protein